MNAAYTADEVLSRIPGWEGADTRELAGGLTNRTYLVEQGGNRAVLKIDTSPRTLPYNDRDEEARVQMAAAEHGLAGSPIFASATAYLTEYLEGHVWTRADLDDRQNLVGLAGALRRLHALPSTGRLFDARAAARRYTETIGNTATPETERHLAVVEAMPAPQNVCCCHNDLVVENIIATPGVRFIDWEYACDNDPLFDLATVVAHHDLPKASRGILMEAYFEERAVQWLERLDAQVSLYHALSQLWRAARAKDQSV